MDGTVYSYMHIIYNDNYNSSLIFTITANEKAREAESKARDLEKKYGQGGPKDKRVRIK